MTFILRSVDIERARGISAGQSFRVDGLGRRVTIVHGPNGAGKSTMALAIQEVLWPGESGLEKPFLKAEWEVDGTSWPVTVEAGHAVGSVVDRPTVGPSGRRGRYLLALHELVALESDTEAEFVRRLVKTSLGGYDVKEAAGRLKYANKPGRPRKLESELRREKDKVRETVALQRDLEQKEKDLEKIRQEHAAARRAQREADILSSVLDVREKDRACREIEALLDGFEPAVKAMRGTEVEELGRIRKGLEGVDKEIELLELQLEQSRRDRDETGFPDGPPTETSKQEWQDAVDRLSDIAHGRPAAQSRLAEAQGVLGHASDALYHVTPSEKLTRSHAQAWSELWRAWAEIRAEGLALDHQEAAVSAVLEHAVDLTGNPESAHRLLARWLRAREPGADMADWPLVVALGVAAAAVLFLAFLAHPAFLVVLLILAAVFFRSRRGRPEERGLTRNQVENEWEQETRMPPPEAWSDAVVLDLYHRLVDQQISMVKRQDAERSARDLEQKRKDWTERHTRLMERVQALEEESGLRTAGEMDSAAWLGIMAQRLVSVEQAQEQVLRAERALQELSDRESDDVQTLSKEMATLGLHDVDSPAAARAAVRTVLERIAAYRDHDKSFKDAQTALKGRLRPRRTELEGDRNALLNRLGLEVGMEHRVEELMVQHAQFASVQKELTEACAVRDHDRLKLEGRVADTDLAVDPLFEMPTEALQSRRDALNVQAALADALQVDITRIETRLEAARSGHDLTEALELQDQALDRLAEEEANATRMIAGWVVADYVQQDVMKRAMPDVFKRAATLLARFTAGALQLEIDLTGSEPKFMARTAAAAPRPISQLSVGERVQLLIAVRVAFLEHEEIVPLPLLVDEALGTSDDDRARVIIDTMLQLAQDGRQIFYFTAQWDEVAKWEERLSASDMDKSDWRVVNLAEIRGLEAARRSPIPERLATTRSVPAPSGLSHSEYGRSLDVPGLSPLRRDVSAEHVWHIVEDVERLQALLEVGVTTVHAWRTLDEHDSPVCGSPETRTAVRAVDTALEEAVKLWRTGRGRPVDRAVLEASGAVSTTFLDPVTELVHRMNGEAARVLSALEQGDVSGFRSNKREDLAEWLQSEGYLDPAEPLGASDARIQLMIRCPDLPQHTLERIIQSLWTTD